MPHSCWKPCGYHNGLVCHSLPWLLVAWLGWRSALVCFRSPQNAQTHKVGWIDGWTGWKSVNASLLRAPLCSADKSTIANQKYNTNTYIIAKLEIQHKYKYNCKIEIQPKYKLQNLKYKFTHTFEGVGGWLNFCGLLAPQSGALRISAYRDFHPIPNPIHPLIAFKHLSLSMVI